MSDVASAKGAPKKMAAVWQPAPVLKAMANKRFIRVQDGQGQTSHFALTSYRHLEDLVQGRAAAGSPDVHIAGHTGHPGANAQPQAGSGPLGLSPGAPAEISDEQLEAIRKQAYERGLSEGRQQQLAEQQVNNEALEAQRKESDAAQTQALLQSIHYAVAQLHENPELRYEPVKRLAVHLAEELVLAELSLSSKAIQSLVERCIDTLDQPAAKQVLVELNPQDLAVLQAAVAPDAANNWRLQAKPELMPGSVQVSADDAMVSDLVENRLRALASKLLAQPERWQAQSTFTPSNLQARQHSSPIEEVQVRPSTAPTASLNPLTSKDGNLNHNLNESLNEGLNSSLSEIDHRNAGDLANQFDPANVDEYVDVAASPIEPEDASSAHALGPGFEFPLSQEDLTLSPHAEASTEVSIEASAAADIEATTEAKPALEPESTPNSDRPPADRPPAEEPPHEH